MLRFLILTASLTAAQGCSAVESTEVTLIDPRLQVIRVLQYEAMLGGELSAQAGLCIDERMTKPGLVSLANVEALSPRALAHLRRSAETCVLAEKVGETDDPSGGGSATRAVGDLRANLVNLREFAEKLRKVRPCLTSAQDIDTMRSCVVASTGAQPTPAEWQQWVALYRTSRS